MYVRYKITSVILHNNIVTLLASKILLIIDVKYWVCLHVKMDTIDMHVNLMYFIFFPMSIKVIMILLNIESYTDA